MESSSIETEALFSSFAEEYLSLELTSEMVAQSILTIGIYSGDDSMEPFETFKALSLPEGLCLVGVFSVESQ